MHIHYVDSFQDIHHSRNVFILREVIFDWLMTITRLIIDRFPIFLLHSIYYLVLPLLWIHFDKKNIFPFRDICIFNIGDFELPPFYKMTPTQKRSRVPRWHQLDSESAHFIDIKSAKKLCGDSKTTFTLTTTGLYP